MIRAVWHWWASLPALLKVFSALIVLALSVLLSPFMVILAVIVLAISVIVLLFKAIRRRPLRSWGAVAGVSLLLTVAFGGISEAIYGGAPGEQASTQEAATQQEEPTQKEEPDEQAQQRKNTTEKKAAAERTREIAEIPAQTTRGKSEETTDEPNQVQREDATEEVAQEQEQRSTAKVPSESGQQESSQASEPPGDQLSNRGTVVTVSRVVDGDTIEVSPAINGVQDVRLIGMDTPETYGGTEPYGKKASAFTTSCL